jgi:hypothetical protein
MGMNYSRACAMRTGSPTAGHARLRGAETGGRGRQLRDGRQTAADVVAAGGSAVIIGQDPGKVDGIVQTLAEEG